jgi:1,2-diacylglycerol-3-alpha-glucose alpha-1,2-glucosyltransferase
MYDKKPVVITTHTVPDEMSLLYRGGKYIQGLFEKYLTFMYNQADLLISPSEFAKKRIQKMGVISTIVVESNGILTSRFGRSEKKRDLFRKNFKIHEKETVVGCVGLPSKRKGLDVFVDLAYQLPDVKFLWIGENVYGRIMKDYRYLDNLKINHPKNLFITGFVDDIQAAYSGMDIFVFPTMIETEGLVILEATCSDIPLIISNVEGLNWVKDKTQCLKATTTEDYAQAIRSLIEHPEKAEQLVKSAKRLLVEKDITVVIKRIIRLYESLL